MKHTFTFILMLTSMAAAKIDLVTLPDRDVTQMTIYNSADLTLIRDGRSLTLKEGANRLQFSWAGTLIDPTSLSMLPTAHADKIDIADLTYPARVQNTGVWNIHSAVDGAVPFEITYLTSGLSWRAFYMGTLTADEETMHLQGYVRVTNHSGEDYENAQTRLIVGQVHLLDQIAELARRDAPYGRPGEGLPRPPAEFGVQKLMRGREFSEMMAMDAAMPSVKEIKKEGLSEYFLYTIEGTETIPNTWSKRLPSFEAADIPVVNLYKHTDDGPVVRYLSFSNDTAHQLGETPIPGGGLKVYRTVDDAGHLAYTGAAEFKYIPVGEAVELNLGAVDDVMVEPTLLEQATDQYRFDAKGNISGWDEIRTVRLTVKNTRDRSVRIELKRNLETPYWTIEHRGQAETYYEKVDIDTIKYALTLTPQSETVLEYVLTTYHGTRVEDQVQMNR